LTETFTVTIGLSLVLSLVGVFSILFLPGTHRHQIPDWEEGLPDEFRTTTVPEVPTRPPF
jgi:hypothetical protein